MVDSYKSNNYQTLLGFNKNNQQSEDYVHIKTKSIGGH